jgi:hypothetical protein
MNIQSLLEHELRQLASGSAATVAVADGPRKLACDVVEHNSLAVVFNRLRLVTTELASATAIDLERISNALAARLTYLMEPIRPIEIDVDACVVQLRSSPPQKDDDGRSYYELLIRRGGEIALSRYRKDAGTPRQQIPATVTCEVLLRLAGDFEAVLD